MKKQKRSKRNNPNEKNLSQHAFDFGVLTGEKLFKKYGPKPLHIGVLNVKDHKWYLLNEKIYKTVTNKFRDYVDYLLQQKKYNKSFSFSSYISGISQKISLPLWNKYNPIVMDAILILQYGATKNGEFDIYNIYKMYDDANYYVNYIVNILADLKLVSNDHNFARNVIRGVHQDQVYRLYPRAKHEISNRKLINNLEEEIRSYIENE